MNGPAAGTAADRAAAHETVGWYRRLLSSTVDLLYVVDAAYRCLEVNESYLAALGRPRERTVGASVADAVGPEQFRSVLKDSIDRSLAGEHVQERAWMRYPKLGRRLMELRYTPLTVGGGAGAQVAVCARDVTEDEQTHALLRRARSFPELNPNVLFEINRHGQVLYVNPRARELFPDLAGCGFEHPLLVGVEPTIERSQGQPEHTQIRDVQVGDATYEQAITYLPEYELFRFYTRDITKSKRAQAALVASEERYRAFAGIASDWDWEMDANLRFTYFSERVEAVTGQRTTDLIGRSRLELNADIVHDARWRRHLDELAAHREFRDFRYQVEAASGKRQWVSVNGQPRFDAGGNFLGYRGTGRLITAEVEALKALEETARALEVKTAMVENILESAAQPIGAFDKFGRLLAANKHYQRLLNLPDELVKPDTNLRDMSFYVAEGGLYGPGDPRELSDTRVRKLLSGQPTKAELTLPDGRVYETLSRSTADGGFVITYSDVTDRVNWTRELERARDAAEQANEAKSAFLAKMSHEIRTPMNGIIGMVRLALDTQLSAKQRDYLTKAQASSQALLSIINDILDFSKVEAGKLRIESVEFELDDVLERVASVVSLRAGEKGLELHYSVDSDVPKMFFGDPLRLGQILLNLATNAVKFTERGEVLIMVRVAAQRDGEFQLRFAVQDSGIGMDAQQQASLFDPFTQADDSTTRKYGGTGLGLSICKQLVEMMGGTIEVESTLGRGTTVSFTTRLEVSDAAVHAPLPATDLRGVRVLVVDDSSAAREIMTRQLEALSMHVTTLASGSEALREVEQVQSGERQYDLVLVDWMMSGMDGLETAARLKRSGRPGKAPPAVIMITAFDRDELLSRPGSESIDAVLTKPVGRSALHNSMLSVLGPGDHLADPAQPPPNDVDETPSRIRRRRALRGKRVLVVDDHSINRQIAKEVLERVGAVIEEAEDGREAVQLVSQAAGGADYDAVLMDVQMPEMDGYEATRHIRGLAHGRSLPIIAITAHAMEEERERCLQAGMDDHVSKPIDPDELLAAVQRWAPSVAANKVAPASPPQRGPTELPSSIVGIDVAAGLARVSGNVNLYRRLLDEFGVRARELVTRLLIAVQRGDWQDASIAAHSLKGLAGNVSADVLFSAASALEFALKSTAPASVGELTRKVEAAFSDVQASLQTLEHSAPWAPGVGRDARRPPGKELVRRLRQLSALLSARDLHADSYYLAIAVDFDLSRCQAEAALIEHDLAQLRYEPAIEAVQRMIETFSLDA